MNYLEKRSLVTFFNPSKRRRVPWWQRTVIYQVYPRSFCDTTGDGTGDLKGITSKASYFTSLGVGTLWLSPIYKSPMRDFGYDVSDFKEVDPIFGTLKDFDDLVREMHVRDIRVVMDFIPNHTSSDHEWFNRSCKCEEPFTHYYIWRPPKGIRTDGSPIPPNNWLSVFGGSAWTYHEGRGEFYYHQFLESQPDLNFRSSLVVAEMEDVLRFWLDRGVDGFRVDAIKHLFETENMDEDEIPSDHHPPVDPREYGSLVHTLTTNQPETLQVLKTWRQIMDQYLDKLLMVEVYDDDIKEVIKYYGDDEESLSDFPFNFYLITNLSSRTDLTGTSLKECIDMWMDKMPDGKWPNWVLGNHDNGRVASRLGSDLVDGLHMVIMLLPGTPVTYYGEEIGMTNAEISYDDTRDPSGLNFGPERYKEFSRDPARTPMQWTSKAMSGFTNGAKTWLPLNPNFTNVNVESEEKSSESHLKVYKELVQLRQEEAFTKGTLEYPVINKNIFTFIRSYNNTQSYLVALNTSRESIRFNLSSDENDIPASAIVIIRSSEDARIDTYPGTRINLKELTLLGGEGLVVQLHSDEDSEEEEN